MLNRHFPVTALRLFYKVLRLNFDLYRKFRERQAFLKKPPNFWENLPKWVFLEHSPIFVLSTGRCGTTLLTSIFRRFPLVQCYHSPQPELAYCGRLAYEEGRRRFEAYKIAVRAARFELIAETIVCEKRYVETNNRITFFAPHLRELFPRARFIHLVRHPADFVRSGVRRQYFQGQYSDLGRIRPISGTAAQSWDQLSAFERCAWLWNETNEFIERFKEDTDGGKVMTIRAEDLFSNPLTTNSILRHCDLPIQPVHLIARWIAKPINKQQDEGSVKPYQSWSEERRADVRRWARSAARYGYEL